MAAEKLHTLDGARGVAAVAVVLYHLSQWNEQRWLAPHGYLAVDFFFCLSGFVIALAYKDRLAGSLTFPVFLLQRIKRLYPVVIAGAIIGAGYYGLMSVGGAHQNFTPYDVGKAFVLNVMLMPYLWGNSPISTANFPLNSPFWSLFYELVINLLWALFLRKFPSWLLFSVSAALVLLVYIVSGESITHPGSYEAVMNFLRVSVGFSGGLLAYDIWKAGGVKLRIAPAIVLFLLAIVLLMPGIVGPWYDQLCMILLFPALTIAGANAVSGAQSEKVLEWLGDISYPLYGIHRPLCQFVLLALTRVHLGAASVVLAFALPLIVSITAAWLVFKYYDEPVRNWLRTVGRRPRLSAPTP